MSYSSRQQRIVSLIAERGNLSIVEFLLTLAVETREVEEKQWQDLVSADPQRFQMFIPQWNQRSHWLVFAIESDTHLAILDFLAVVRDLLARKLVSVLPDPRRHVRASAIVRSINTPTINDRDRAALEIDALLQTSSEILQLAIYTERVYALPSLSAFIANGYRDAHELSLTQQVEAQQRQFRILNRLWISVVLLLILLIAGIVTMAIIHHNDSSTLRRENQMLRNSLQQTPTHIKADTVVIHDTLVVESQKPKPRVKKRRRYNTDEVN